eukprot:884870-Prymnesium_polylepis.1
MAQTHESSRRASRSPGGTGKTESRWDRRLRGRALGSPARASHRPGHRARASDPTACGLRAPARSTTSTAAPLWRAVLSSSSNLAGSGVLNEYSMTMRSARNGTSVSKHSAANAAVVAGYAPL